MDNRIRGEERIPHKEDLHDTEQSAEHDMMAISKERLNYTNHEKYTDISRDYHVWIIESCS